MNTQEEVKIFIVEDEPFFANLINYDLEANYYKGIKVFFTGEECIDNLHLKPKVVILDHSLPGMSGLEVLQQIKTFEDRMNVEIFDRTSIPITVTPAGKEIVEQCEKIVNQVEEMIAPFKKKRLI